MITDADISEFLISKSIKPSFQRMKVYEYLIRNKNHPTVEMIHQELVQQIPTLSKTTVYNTLKLFIEKKITTLITIDESETRYDADTSIHGHFQCSRCGKVHDVFLDNVIFENEFLKKTQISEYHIYFKGLCNCQDDEQIHN